MNGSDLRRRAIVAIALFGGCALQQGDKHRCQDDADCVGDRVCDLGICRSRTAASGGDSGSAAGGDAGRGGSGGVRGGSGGAGLEPSAGEGGFGGAGESGAISAGGDDANGGRASGAGGEPDRHPSPPELGAACMPNGAKGCSAAHPEVSLLCDDGEWVIGTLCRPLHRCHPSTFQCASVASACVMEPQGICFSDGTLLDCLTDPFNPIDRSCPFGCANGACLDGTGDQLAVHTELHSQRTMNWSHTISVCFADDPGPVIRNSTRSAVEEGWGRYLDVDFAGWGDCENEDASGIVLEFPRGCRGRLANHVTYTLGPGRIRLGICQTYFDASGHEQDLANNEALARFLARHQFGHALGLGEKAFTEKTVMRRTVQSSTIDLTVWAEDIASAFDGHGYKPAGSIVQSSGWCLDVDSTVGLSRCSAADAQTFEVRIDRLLAADGRCLVVNDSPPDASIALETCEAEAPSNALALRRARFGTPGHCVTPLSLPVTAGTPLETRPCAGVGDPAQSFRFDTLPGEGGSRVGRIHFAASDYCISAPPAFGGIDVATLEPCATSAAFAFGPSGDVSVAVPNGRRCLGYVQPDSVLRFQSCIDQPFLFSGPLETSDGRALSSVADDPTVSDDPSFRLSIVALAPNATPGPNEVFDVHF